jgi:hypothetical protein
LIKLFWLSGDREAIKISVKLTSFFFVIIFYLIFSKIFFSSTKNFFFVFHFDRRNYFWSRANQQNIFNQILSVFSSAECFCVSEKFMNTSNSMASTFLGLNRCERKLFWKIDKYFWMIQKMNFKLKETQKSLAPWLLQQSCWAWPIVSLSLVLSYFFELLIFNFAGSQGRTFI